MADCLVPEYFDRVVTSVRVVSGFDEHAHVYTTPTLALKIGHSLKEKECASLEMDRCSVQGTASAMERRKKHQLFLSFCERKWSREVSSHVLRSLRQRKFNKPTVLPLAEDVRLLHTYLTARGDACLHSLSDQPTIASWSELCQITLTQIVTFNRRRAGEAQRMLVSAYCSDNAENVNDDVRRCLSQIELALCKEFRIIHVEGKRGRRVPVLLTQSQIGILLELKNLAAAVYSWIWP